jgi:Arc/MetJ-type ribon-helix-helix transcriptional regulator
MASKGGAMHQAKFSCKENQVEFLNNYKDYGFKDKSAMVRESLNLLREKLEAQKLRESADLYAETYRDDSELKALTDSAVQGWPE